MIIQLFFLRLSLMACTKAPSEQSKFAERTDGDLVCSSSAAVASLISNVQMPVLHLHQTPKFKICINIRQFLPYKLQCNA